MSELILRAPQIPMVKFIRDLKRGSLWAGMGIGKSSATLWTLDYWRILGEIDRRNPTLVIGPMRVARDTWPAEVAKWEQFKDLIIVPLTGTPAQRVDKLMHRADIFTISYEMLPWLVEYYMGKWPFRQVIADEADRLKGFRLNKGGERASQIGRVAHTLVDRWINLTGTPAPAGYKDLWGQNWYVDKGLRLGRTFGAFQQRWFKPKWSGFGVDIMPHSQKEIDALLADVCLTIDPKDYFDLREPIVRQIRVDLPAAARKVYKKLEDEMFYEFEALGEKVNVMNAAALAMKCMQLANGAVYTERPKWVGVHDQKLDALKSIVHEACGMPILLAYNFQSDAARILKAFPAAVELKEKDGMKRFMAGKAPIGIAHPKSMGHGIDGLQNVTNILVRFGHDWKTGERLQMLERIGPMRQLQASKDRAVFVYDIIANDTLDDDILKVHDTNISVQDALLGAMKRRAG